MPPLTVDQIADMVVTTQKNLGRLKWTELASDLQDFIALPQMLKKKKVGFQSGTAIQFQARMSSSGSARRVGLFEENVTHVGDVMQSGEVPWRHAETSYAFERREMLMNRNPQRIVDLIKVRRIDAMVDLAEMVEEDFWGCPEDSDNKDTPFGVKYWLVRHATVGFNGGAPSGFTTVGNLNPTAYPRWKNYTGAYTSVSKEDLIRKMRKGMRFTKFRSPVPVPTYNTGDNYGYFTNNNVLEIIEEIVEAQNDNLGDDAASKANRSIFFRRPVRWVPFLEDDDEDPVYGINFGVFKPVFLRGDYLREDRPTKAPKQRNVMEVGVDLTYNYICRDRRRNFVFHKAA